MTLSVLFQRIVDAVADDVEDGEARSLATASQQHFHVLAQDMSIVWSKLCVTIIIVCCRNLGKTLAQEPKTMVLSASVNVFEKEILEMCKTNKK